MVGTIVDFELLPIGYRVAECMYRIAGILACDTGAVAEGESSMVTYENYVPSDLLTNTSCLIVWINTCETTRIRGITIYRKRHRDDCKGK
jgi:hypothetical protein